jgi:hypothetical protein
MGSLGLVAALLLGAGTAQAEQASPDPVHVVVDGGSPNVELRLTRGNGEETLLRCQGRCEFFAPRGRYRVHARDSSTGKEYELGLRVKHSSAFRLRQGDSSARTAGLVLGIAGSASVLTGMILVLPSLMSGLCHDSEGDGCLTEGERTMGKVGVGLLLAGAIATPIGWIMFGQNGTRLVLLDEQRSGVAPGDRFGLGFGGVAAGGLGLSAMARF